MKKLLRTVDQTISKNQIARWALIKCLIINSIIVVTMMSTVARERVSDVNNKTNMTIEGVVRDEEGNLVKAATVSIKETAKGTSTDDNGKFKLDGVVIGNTLLISHKHYESFSIEISGTTKLDFITLRKKDNNLNEIFIEQKNEDQKAESNLPPYSNQGHSNPYLIVLDGKIVEDKERLKKIDPNTIQSVEVLRKESDVAVYGSRGKNGIVRVVTKKR